MRYKVSLGGYFPAEQNLLENEMFLLSVHPPHQIKAPALLLLRSAQQLLINLEQAPSPVTVIGDSSAPTMPPHYKNRQLD